MPASGDTLVESYSAFIQICLSIPMWLFIAIVASDMLSEDTSSKSTYLYFSRPIKRVDYLIGKYLAVFFLCSMLTIIPITMSFFMVLLRSGESWSFMYHSMDTYAKGMIFLFFMCILFSGLVLMFSSLTDNGRQAAIMFLGFILAAPIVAEIAVGVSGNESLAGIEIWDTYNNNTIMGNNINSNCKYGNGIYCIWSSYNTIKNNNFSYNYNGIISWRGNHNIIINNV